MKYKDIFGVEYEEISEYLEDKLNGETTNSGELESMRDSCENNRRVISNLINLLMDLGVIKGDNDTVDKILKGIW